MFSTWTMRLKPNPLIMTEHSDNSKSGLVKVALISLVIILPLTCILLYRLNAIGPDLLSKILMIPLMPGLIIYVMTGDVHFGRPIAMQIIGIAFGSLIFWTPLIYWIYGRWKKKKTNS